MDRASYLDSLRGDADDLLTAASGHVGRVYRRTASWVAGDGSRELPRAPEGAVVVDWARAGLDELLAALDKAGEPEPGATVATWAGDQPAIFWPRRMAVETAVHRWDAETAVGDARPLGTDLALDGVDELFAVIVPWRGAQELADEAAGRTMHLHATDVPSDEAGQGEWLVTIGPEGLAVEHVHAQGDVGLRGTAADLLLLLYNRVPAERCDVFGDAMLLERWRTTVRV